ncbi:hypothetical protein [Vreelandella alkaliphila]|uniref:Uncharacterized protein n=1 Tax=Vreelandella alkaliphila TaxID=272774 RepID=A0AAJ2VSH3_9GAMM|nr:hypothetical protein [Halomonas alkaliphila]MDX5979649.1 hypothetical protein [Halomonas alkaliphila]
MAKITGSVGNVGLFQESYNTHVAKGEGLIGTDFLLEIEGYEDNSTLIQAFQLPPLMREMIESFGPMGVRFLQAGNYNNAAEIPITFKEVINGDIYTMVRDWVVNKRYLRCRLRTTSESKNGQNAQSHGFIMHDCWLNLDGVDLSVEDRAALVKPAGTLHANYIEPIAS